MVWQQTFSVREESIGHRGVNGGVEWGLTLDIARRFFLFFSFFSAFFLVLVPFFFSIDRVGSTILTFLNVSVFCVCEFLSLL